MRTSSLGILWVCLTCSALPVVAQTESELDVLRAELAQMRADYESRIAQLEKRLDEAEQKAAGQQAIHRASSGSGDQNQSRPLAS